MTRAHGATARLFVAVDPPPRVCERLAAWAKVAVRGLGLRRGASSPVRVLEPEGLHVTLCFLGERPVGEIDAIADTLAECAAPVGELRVGAPVWLPPRRPRALAVEVHNASDLASSSSSSSSIATSSSSSPAYSSSPTSYTTTNPITTAGEDGERGESLVRLHGELIRALDRACGHREEKRRFRAHITLARVRNDGRTRARTRGYGFERSLPATPALAFTPDALVLYRSWLSPEGASYEALARRTLVPT